MSKVLKAIGLAALYFVIAFGCMFLGFISPFLWIYQPVLAAFLGAFPIMVACRYWQKPGAILLGPGVFALVMVLMGESSGALRLSCLVIILAAAELIRWGMKYNSQQAARISYSISALIPATSLFLLWTDKEFYYNGAVEEMGSVAYADGLMKFATPIGLIALIVCTLIAGYVGSIVAEKVLKEKATVS